MNKGALLLTIFATSAVITLSTGYYCTASAKVQPEATKYDVVNGIVRGIVYDGETPSAIVGQELVGEGAVINGVKVIRIHKDKVVFENNRRRWTQQVGEQPNPAWSRVNLF